MESLINAKARLDKARDTFAESLYALRLYLLFRPQCAEESILARQDNEERMVEGLDLEERGR